MGSWMMYLLLSLNGDPIIPYRRLDERRQPSTSKISTKNCTVPQYFNAKSVSVELSSLTLLEKRPQVRCGSSNVDRNRERHATHRNYDTLNYDRQGGLMHREFLLRISSVHIRCSLGLTLSVVYIDSFKYDLLSVV